MDEDGLESNSDYLNDSIGYENTAGNGVTGVEDSHGDGEHTVDVDEKDSEVKEKQIERVLHWVFPLYHGTYLEESNKSLY